MGTLSNGKAFFLHKDKSIARSFARALGYKEDFSLFHESKTLLENLKESKFPPEVLSFGGDSLTDLKSILDFSFGTRSNKIPIIIFSFTKPETLIKVAKNIGFLELEECHAKELIKMIQVPFIRDEIQEKAKEFIRSYGSKEAESRNVWKIIAKRMADEQDKRQRHSIQNLRAAKRIFNGAIRSGYYNLVDAEERQRAIMLYERLIDNALREGDLEKEKKAARDIIWKAESELRSGIRELKPKQFEVIRKVLVVDDQKEMWKPVWDFLFGEGKIDIVAKGIEAFEKLRGGLEYDFALIDIYLGDSQPSGLEILRNIRKITLDLPVVMLTAYDNAELTRTCYELGASFYFVKEREDRGDRDSFEYFAAFRKMILQLRCYHSEERTLARRLQAIELPLKSQWRESAEALSKSLFFLLLDPQESGPRRFLGGASPYAKAAFYAHRAVERQVDLALERAGVIELDGERIAIKSLSKKIASGIVANILSKDASYLLVSELCAKCGGMGHLRSRIEDRNQEELKRLALKSFGEALTWFKKMTLRTPKPMMDVSPEALDILLLPNILPTTTPRLEHSQRELAGANRILWGMYLHFGSEIPADRKGLDLSVNEIIAMEREAGFLPSPVPSQYACLFIDDEGEALGWRSCLEVLLPNIGVDYLEYEAKTAVKEILKRAEMADFVILDLNLPDVNGAKSEQIGLVLLEELKRAYPALPVVVLTACADALTFRRAITRGAFDSFPKTNEDYFDIDDHRYFTCYYERFCSIIDSVRNYLERGSVQVYKRICLNEHNPFWPLDFLKIDGKPFKNITASQTLLGGGVDLPFSELASTLVREAFMRAFFFSTKAYSPTVRYLVHRLYLTSEGSKEADAPEYDAVMAAGEAAEFLIKIVAGLSFPEMDMAKVTGGKILNDRSFVDFRDKNRHLVDNFDPLWALRMRAKKEEDLPDGCKHLVRVAGFTGEIALWLIERLSKQILGGTSALVLEAESKYVLYSKYFQAVLETENLRIVMEGLLPIFQREASGGLGMLGEAEKGFLRMFLNILVDSVIYTRASKILDSSKAGLETDKSRRWDEKNGEIRKLGELQAEKKPLLAEKEEMEHQLRGKSGRKGEIEKQLEKYYLRMGATTGSTVRKGAQSLQTEFKEIREEIERLNAKKGENEGAIHQNNQAIKMQVGVLQGLFKDLEELRKKEAKIRKIGHEIEELEWRKKYYLLFPVEEHVMHLERLFELLRQSTPDRSHALSNLETVLQKIRSLLDLSKYRSLGEFFSDAHEVLEAVDEREIYVRLKGRFFKADIHGTSGWVFEPSGMDEKILVEVESCQTADAEGEIEIFWDKIRREPSSLSNPIVK